MPDEYDEYEEYDGEEPPPPLGGHESALVRQDLIDLDRFHATFGAEGYRGVSVYCQDCDEEHYYPWEMLRENLQTLLETGETPVHEPAFAPDPDDYVPWEYARGYVDALADAGVNQRRDTDRCPHCGMQLAGALTQGNFCPRCGSTLVGPRLRAALEARGLDKAEVEAILRETGLPD